MKNVFKVLTTALVISCALAACDDKTADNVIPVTEEKFAITATTDNTRTVHIVSSVTEGSVNVTAALEYSLYQPLVSENKIYQYSAGAKKFNKSILNADGTLTEEAALPIVDAPSSSFNHICKLDDDRVIGLFLDYTQEFSYRVINLKTMVIEKTGIFEMSFPENTLSWANSIHKKGDKLFLTYQNVDPDSFVGNDIAYVAVFKVSDISYVKTLEDTRTASMGYSSSLDGGLSENGDLYLSSSPSDYWGINENKPSGILRIKASEEIFDPTYFFDVTAATVGKHMVGLNYIGNGKAITNVIDKTLVVEYDDFSNKFVMEHWVLDLNTKTATKLNIPKGKGPGLPYVKINDGRIAIPLNTENGNFIYIYNPADGSVAKGLEYIGATKFNNLIKIQ